MHTKVVLFEDGSWEWEENVSDQALAKIKHVLITVGEGWSEKEVSAMIRDYYIEMLDWLFDKESA